MKTDGLWGKIKSLPFLRLFLNGTFSGGGTLLSIVFFIAVVLAIFMSQSKIAILDGSLEATALLVSPVEIKLEEIDEVSIRSLGEFDRGERASGFSNLFTTSGSYTNHEFGIYDIYLKKSNDDNLVIIRYSDICYLAINEKTAEDTVSLYEQISSQTNSK